MRSSATTNHDVIAFLTNMAEYIDEGLAERRRQAQPLGPLRHDLERPGRHGALLPDGAGARHHHRRRSSPGRDLQAPRVRDARDALCGPHARDPRRADDDGHEVRLAGPGRGSARSTGSSAPATTIAVGAISGAVGSYSNIDPFVEEYVCEKLGLTPEPLSTQVIPRDRHAQYLAVLATVAATAEEIATEVPRAAEDRHASRPKSRSPRDRRAPRRCRTSATPSPAERVCGLARVVKANAQVGFDDVALWHERDISHSGAERVVLPDSTIALDYLLSQAGVDPRRAGGLSGGHAAPTSTRRAGSSTRRACCWRS